MSSAYYMNLYFASTAYLPNPISNPRTNYFAMKNVFSDNARAYYKKGSLSYGTVGTVRNGRHIWKHT